MKHEEDLEEFGRFQAVYSKAAWDQVLKPRRQAGGNPNWQPSWMEGVYYERQVFKILQQQFDVSRTVSGSPRLRLSHAAFDSVIGGDRVRHAGCAETGRVM